MTRERLETAIRDGIEMADGEKYVKVSDPYRIALSKTFVIVVAADEDRTFCVTDDDGNQLLEDEEVGDERQQGN